MDIYIYIYVYVYIYTVKCSYCLKNEVGSTSYAEGKCVGCKSGRRRRRGDEKRGESNPTNQRSATSQCANGISGTAL